MLKRSIVFLIAFSLSLMLTTNVSAAEKNYLNIDHSTDKENYDKDKEVTTTIEISNSSEILDAENTEIKTELPDGFKVTDDDVKTEDGEVIWDVEKIGYGETEELTLKTEIETDDGKKGETEENEDKSSIGSTPNNGSSGDDATSSKASQQENLSAPQTGDESSIFKYIIILIISVVVGAITFFLVRKKSFASFLSIFFAITLLSPAWIGQADSEENIHTVTEIHKITIDDQEYELETTVSGDMQDNREQIPVTGTTYQADDQVLTNKTLTFSATIDGETVEQTVETDDEGYFVARLYSNTTYNVKGDNVEASIEVLEQNGVDLTNDTGKIELGKSLANGENKTELQPSVIYLNDEETEQIVDVADDLSTVTIDEGMDIEANDLIVIPEWDENPSSLSFEVQSVTEEDGQLVLEVEEPEELEEIFEEIQGDIDEDLSADTFVPASGIEVEEGTTEPQTFSQATTPEAAMENGLEVKIKEEGLPIEGSLNLKGSVEGDVNFRTGLNPVEDFDVLFEGEQTIDIETKAGIDSEETIPAGEAIIPTQIPLVSISMPVDLNVKAKGEVSVSFSAGAEEQFGLTYENGEGFETYPDEHFKPVFETSEVEGSASLSVALQQSLGVNATLFTLAEAKASAGPKGTLETDFTGDDAFVCTDFDVSFDADLKFAAPVVDWESDAAFEMSKEVYSNSYGDCINDIETDPDEIELDPDETKSFDVIGSNEGKGIKETINGADNLSFDASSDDVTVDANSDGIDVTSSEDVQDGDEVTIDITYDGLMEEHTTSLTVKLVDDRDQGTLSGTVVDAVEEIPIENAEIDVYADDEQVDDAETDEEGNYEIELAPGDYKLEVRSDDYITDTTRVEIESTETTTYESKLLLVDDEHQGEGTAAGTIKDAVTDEGVPGIDIEIREGKNNTSGDVIEELVTEDDGSYSVELPAGNYTMSLSGEDYIETEVNILSVGGEEITDQDASISADEEVGEGLRIVLRWGEKPRDLDSHITGPTDDGERFHVYYPFGNMEYKDDLNDVELDRDDTQSYGPETVTVLKQTQDGTYTYAVHNFTGRHLNEDNEFDLANSDAEVKVYKDNTLLETFNVPDDQSGNSWRVLEVRDGEIVPINEMETIEDWHSADSFAPME